MYIASLWEVQEGNQPIDRDMLRRDLHTVDAHKRDPMSVRLLRRRQGDQRPRIANGIAADGLGFMQVAERHLTRIS